MSQDQVPTSAPTFLGAHVDHEPAYHPPRGKWPAHSEERDSKHPKQPNQKQPLHPKIIKPEEGVGTPHECLL